MTNEVGSSNPPSNWTKHRPLRDRDFISTAIFILNQLLVLCIEIEQVKNINVGTETRVKEETLAQ